MAKVLTAARVRVPPANEADYLATLRELCQFAEARGQRIWVQASRLPEEIKLEKRLQGLGTYAPDAWELWTEVSLAATAEA